MDFKTPHSPACLSEMTADTRDEPAPHFRNFLSAAIQGLLDSRCQTCAVRLSSVNTQPFLNKTYHTLRHQQISDFSIPSMFPNKLRFIFVLLLKCCCFFCPTCNLPRSVSNNPFASCIQSGSCFDPPSSCVDTKLTISWDSWAEFSCMETKIYYSSALFSWQLYTLTHTFQPSSNRLC